MNLRAQRTGNSGGLDFVNEVESYHTACNERRKGSKDLKVGVESSLAILNIKWYGKRARLSQRQRPAHSQVLATRGNRTFLRFG